MTSSGSIAERLAEVRQRVGRAAEQGGRDPSSIVLVAVTKHKPSWMVREAHAAGQRDFGENYVQEMVDKAAELADLPDLRWHLIGHLQTNKARKVVEVAHLVHSVDSVHVAEELAKRAQQAGVRLSVLVEVNVGQEQSKTGASSEQAGSILAAARASAWLQVRGLMTVPPFELDAAHTAPYFDRLRGLRDELGGEAQLPELSMGMSHDYEVAIGRGATIVRVGTAIFGERE